MIRYLLALGVSLLLFALPASGATPTAERKKLIIGGDHDNPPYELLVNGNPTGFNVDLMRAVAEVTGIDVEIRLGPWHMVRRELEEGKIDALAGMYYSAPRSKLIDFSLPHTMVSSGIFVRKGSPIRSFADLRGKEVIVQEGDVAHDYLKQNGLTSHIVTVNDPTDELRLLASGNHDCAFMPSMFQGVYLAKSLDLANLRAINTELPQLRYCFAVRKGNRDLLYRLDEGLNILKVNGKYQEIYEKWFGVYEKRDVWQTVKYFIWALAAIGSLLTASFIWSWFLKREVRIRTAKLRESEEMFRVLAETSPAGIFLYQGERIVYVNAATASMFGYTEEECLQMKFWDWVHDDFKELVSERGLARQQGEQVPSRYECKHVCKNGEERWMFVSAGLIEYKGKPAGIVTSFDITDRKRMEDELQHAHDELEKRVEERSGELAETVKALRESRDYLDMIINTITDPIFVKDRGHRLVLVNDAECVLTGHSREDVIGRNDYEFFPKEQVDVFWETDEMVFTTGKENINEEEITDAQGEIRVVVTKKSLYNDMRGNKFIVGIMRDITEQKHAEKQLMLNKQMLEELNCTLEEMIQEEVAKNREKDTILIQQNRQAALGELLEHIAHQWKQPLNVINLMIFNLGETYSLGELSDEHVKTTIDKIMELTEHMAQTINVFRDFYKPEKEIKPFRIKESIDRALSFVAPALRFHAIGVELDVDPELFALGYPKEYAHVILNILANARDAFRERNAEKRLVKISAFAKENKAVVTLTDNAGGISAAIIDKIFDIYFTTKESSGGTGIGLYMSKNIIEKNMGGTLSCRNVDQGAEFRIELNIPGDEKTGLCS
jgi:PAS domain S-box-containing protein